MKTIKEVEKLTGLTKQNLYYWFRILGFNDKPEYERKNKKARGQRVITDDQLNQLINRPKQKGGRGNKR